MRSSFFRPLALIAWVLVVICARSAGAQVAPTPSVSASTLKLPDGPGSVKGLADPASVSVFTGQVGYAVPIGTPSVGGLSPSLALTYSGALGNGPRFLEDGIWHVPMRRPAQGRPATSSATDRRRPV